MPLRDKTRRTFGGATRPRTPLIPINRYIYSSLRSHPQLGNEQPATRSDHGTLTVTRYLSKERGVGPYWLVRAESTGPGKGRTVCDEIEVYRDGLAAWRSGEKFGSKWYYHAPVSGYNATSLEEKLHSLLHSSAFRLHELEPIQAR